MEKEEMIRRFEGVYGIDNRIATKNLVPGRKIYGENLVSIEGVEYRLWNPKRSKLAAAILRGLKEMPLKSSSKVLYLGAASGTTASHISDIACEGLIYCVEFSPRVFRELLAVCALRSNMIPILADAQQPMRYAALAEKCDFIFQDIAQPNQTEIFAQNALVFIRRQGSAMIAIKARAIDAAAKPKEIFQRELKKMRSYGFEVLQEVPLEPYERDHLLVHACWRG